MTEPGLAPGFSYECKIAFDRRVRPLQLLPQGLTVPLGYAFKNALKSQRRYVRRIDVCGFFLFGILILSEAGLPWKHSYFDATFPYLMMLLSVAQPETFRRQSTTIPVSSLDERAYLRYAREFDQLNDMEQQQILSHYRVGTYLLSPKLNPEVEELFRTGKAKANADAHRMLLWGTPVAAIVYAAGLYLRSGDAVRHAWTTWLAFLFVAVLTTLALPRLLWRWREPELSARQRFDLPDWV